MRIIDADKIYVIPAEDDNITGMGMTREEQDAYNDGIDAVMEKIRQAQTIDPYKSVLEIIDTAQTYKMFVGEEDTYIDKRELREAVEELREGKE